MKVNGRHTWKVYSRTNKVQILVCFHLLGDSSFIDTWSYVHCEYGVLLRNIGNPYFWQYQHVLHSLVRARNLQHLVGWQVGLGGLWGLGVKFGGEGVWVQP